MSEEWVAVAKVQDLGAGEMKAARAGDEDVVVYNLDGDFYATHGICTHAYAMLVDGFVDGDVVECPFHGGCFEIKTGKGLGPPIGQDLKTYETRVNGEDVEIRIGS